MRQSEAEVTADSPATQQKSTTPARKRRPATQNASGDAEPATGAQQGVTPTSGQNEAEPELEAVPRPAGSKADLLIGLLKREEGASIDELTAAAGWQAHSVRGFISGTLKKRLGMTVTSAEGRDRDQAVSDRGLSHAGACARATAGASAGLGPAKQPEQLQLVSPSDWDEILQELAASIVELAAGEAARLDTGRESLTAAMIVALGNIAGGFCGARGENREDLNALVGTVQEGVGLAMRQAWLANLSGGGGRMTGRVAAEIAALRDLDQDDLRRRWRMLSGKPAPLHLPRALLVRLIAYRLQANAFGDLDSKSRRLLDGLARSGKGAGKNDETGVPPRPELRPLLPGTHLVREHEGVLHRVMVLEEGFAWNGSTYGASPRWRGRSPGRAGTVTGSSACRDKPALAKAGAAQ